MFGGARQTRHHPGAVLQLPDRRLLLRAACRGARPPGPAERRDDARPPQPAALRARAARPGGAAEPRPEGRGRSTRRNPSSSPSGDPRRPGSRRSRQLLFDWFRAPSLTVTLKDDQAAVDPEDRVDAPQPLHAGAADDLLRRPEDLYRQQVAHPEAALHAAYLDRRALRPDGEDAAQQPGDADALGASSPAARRRGRTDHPQGSRPPRGVRRAVHPRDDLDPQSHLPLRPPRRDGGHAGHRRSDLDDPLHQQGLSVGAADPCRPAGAGDDRHPGSRRHRAHRRHARLSAGGQDSGRIVQPRRPQGRYDGGAEERSSPSSSRTPTCCSPSNSCRRRSTGAIGVLAGQPLFVCQYKMAKQHWQIVNHRARRHRRGRPLQDLRRSTRCRPRSSMPACAPPR